MRYVTIMIWGLFISSIIYSAVKNPKNAVDNDKPWRKKDRPLVVESADKKNEQNKTRREAIESVGGKIKLDKKRIDTMQEFDQNTQIKKQKMGIPKTNPLRK